MESFSQRKGIKPVKNIIQIESMDDDLRNRLWDALCIHYWNKIDTRYLRFISEFGPPMQILLKRIWHSYFKRPIDTINDSWFRTYDEIRKYFFKCTWNEAYDFIQFIANSYSDESVNSQFRDFCNSILKEELSAYRFVGGKIAQITKEEEIAEIEEALRIPISPVQQHINRSLELLSDKKSPDYRNSIKESISAVEAICQLISKNNKATLTLALDTIAKGKKVDMHPALKTAFEKLYGYTNAAEGIRHALSDEPNLDSEDAKFMLVSCSGFINYLIVKSSKAGITL
jgi:hypothetical protein